MIQLNNNSKLKSQGLENIQVTGKMPVQENEIIKNKSQRLNIYEEHLKITSPTYSEEIKKVMQKEDIKESHLNAMIIKNMNKGGMDIKKSALDTIVNQLQEGDLFKLFQQGYEIEKLTVDIIAKELKKSENGPIDLPKTRKNLEVLDQYKEKIESIIEDTDLVATNMVRHRSEITVNNLYAAKHRGVPKDSGESPTEEEIIAVLNMNGIKVTQANMNAARSLIGGSIEITKGTIESFIKIKGSINNIDSQDLITRAISEMKKGQNPGDLNISQQEARPVNKYEFDEIKQMVEDIKSIDHTVIEDTYNQGKAITIGNLQQTLHENIDKVLKGNKQGVTSQGETKEKLEIKRRQVEEIRLSLTLEAALKLNNKVDIKTIDLSKVIEELKLIENQNNRDILANVGVAVTEENIDLMEKTNQRLYNISQNKEIAVVRVVQEEAEFTLKGMDEAISLKQVQDRYQETGSKPERRFGEGISKVQEQIGHILEINEIAGTSSNIKAAKALIENNIEIRPEAVEKAKGILLKIETVLYQLRPALVASIIQEGIRPDTMPIDHMISYIRQKQQANQVNPNQKIAEAILELDKTNRLNSKEREGLVAVYRMLNTISKNETASIGFLLEHGKEPTLGNLFEASKYIKQIGSKTGKMDVTIDDDLGLRQGESPANIRRIIQEATKLPANIETLDKWQHTKNVVDQWLSRITPDELKTYIDMDKSLEELELQDGKTSSFEVERMTKQAKALEDISPHTLNFLKERDIPLTIPNLYWLDKMIKNPYLLGEMLEDYERLTQEKISSPINNSNKENITEILDDLDKDLESHSSQWLSGGHSAQAYSIGRELEQMLGVQKQISEQDGFYQIPVLLHHGMSNLNMYVMKDKDGKNQEGSEELKAYMSIKTKNLGVIQVNMRISDKAVAFEMIGETPEVTLGLQKGAKELKDQIEEIGYHVIQAKFSQGKTGITVTDPSKASDSALKRFEESKFEYII